jgi:hypothetical protein
VDEQQRQFPKRPREVPEPEHRGPSEATVEPEVPSEDNEPADERVEIVKEPRRRG